TNEALGNPMVMERLSQLGVEPMPLTADGFAKHDGRNVRIDYRWGAGDAERIRKYATEFVTLAPDLILATGAVTVRPLLQATRVVPIVFVQVPDAVGAGFVDSCSSRSRQP